MWDGSVMTVRDTLLCRRGELMEWMDTSMDIDTRALTGSEWREPDEWNLTDSLLKYLIKPNPSISMSNRLESPGLPGAENRFS